MIGEREIRVADVVVGHRFRKDLGDVVGLARSIEALGLLQPIGVTPDSRLVFGERRLVAVRDVLKRATIAARVVNVESLLLGECHENEVRKDFTPSERVAIGAAVEIELGNRQGARTDLAEPESKPQPGLFDGPPQHVAEVTPGTETRQAAAKAAGFGNAETYRQAKRVVETGAPELVDAMDKGAASIRAAADVATLPADVQREVVAAGPVEIKRAAKQVREGRRPPRRALADDLAERETRPAAPTPESPAADFVAAAEGVTLIRRAADTLSRASDALAALPERAAECLRRYEELRRFADEIEAESQALDA